MATLTPTENSTQAGQTTPQASGGEKPGVWAIPGSFNLGSRRIEISKIEVSGKLVHPTAQGGLHLKGKDEVRFTGANLGIYDRADFLDEGSGSSLKKVLIVSESGGSIISFTVPDFDSSIKDGGYFWLKLLSKNVPQASRTISPYLVYQIEENEEEEKKRKAAEEARKKEKGGQKTGGGVDPTTLVMESMGGVFDGIGGAVAGLVKSGAPSAPKSGSGGTAVSGAKAVVESSGEGSLANDFDSEEVEHVAEGESLTSTGQISTGGQTISESGTVSGTAGTTIAESGTATIGGTSFESGTIQSTSAIGTSGTVSGSQTTEVSSGGNVGTRISAEVSGQAAGGSASASQTVSQGGAVTSGVTGGGQASQEAQAQGTSTTQVSGQSRTEAGGEATAEVKTTGTAGQQVGSAGGVSASVKAGEEVKGQTSAKISGTQKSEVKVSSPSAQKAAAPSPASAPAAEENKAGGEKKEEPPKSPQPAQTAIGKGSVDGIGTAGKGLGGPSFGGSTSTGNTGFKPPAGLGNIISLDFERDSKYARQNIAGGLPKTSPKTKDSAETADQAGRQPNDSNRSGPSAASGGSPDDEKKVTPPLGDSRSPSSESPDADKNAEQPDGRPIDSAARAGGGSPEDADVEKPMQMAGEDGDTEGPKDSDQGEPKEKGDESEPGETGLPEENPQDQPSPEPEASPEAPGAADQAAGALADSKAGQELLEKTSGQLWWYAFGVSAATFFTGLDFLVGALGMDAYWIFGHRKEPKLFPMKGWQKVVTIFANVFPFILITLGLSFILVAGCNWPVPKSNILPTYRGTVIGAIIGDSCKTFDLTNMTAGQSPFKGGDSGGGGAASSWEAPPATGGGTNPRGPTQ